ncbi:MAG: ketoacyl-ACP synthase III [Hellea sp.]|nr:ketoacyl-ACP synthase III [Hellea sp.]
MIKGNNIVTGVGSYLPERVVTNDELARKIDTSDEWIKERSGIRQRHIAAEGEYTSDLGVAAARRAIEDANMSVNDLDLIIVATTTPDLTFPSTASIIQEKLEMRHGAAFDIQAVCSGFIYALHIADSMLRAGPYKNALVIGAETFSRILDWEDRSTCVLFGDGAGAMVLSTANDSDSGIIANFIRSDGRYCDLLYVDGGPSRTQSVGHVRMVGNQVFRRAVKDIAIAMKECAAIAGIEPKDIDWFVPHQANQRILDGVGRQLGLTSEQIISTVAHHANTSAASVPLAFDVAMRDGRIKRGDLVMLEAFGGGFTWGATLLRF